MLNMFLILHPYFIKCFFNFHLSSFIYFDRLRMKIRVYLKLYYTTLISTEKKKNTDFNVKFHELKHTCF